MRGKRSERKRGEGLHQKNKKERGKVSQRRQHEIGRKQKEFRRHKRHAWEGEKQGGMIFR